MSEHDKIFVMWHDEHDGHGGPVFLPESCDTLFTNFEECHREAVRFADTTPREFVAADQVYQEIAALRERAERSEAACFQAQEAAKNEMHKAMAAEATVERLRGALGEIEQAVHDGSLSDLECRDTVGDIVSPIVRALAGEEPK